MGALSDARRRTGRFLREHEWRLESVGERIKQVAAGLLERGASGSADRSRASGAAGMSPPAPSSSRPQAASPSRGSIERLMDENTKAELMRRAHELEIKGRSRMTKRQLAEEISARD